MCRFYKALYSLIPLKRIRYYLIKKHFFACSCCQEDWEEVEDRLKDMWSLQDWIKSEGNLWPEIKQKILVYEEQKDEKHVRPEVSLFQKWRWAMAWAVILIVFGLSFWFQQSYFLKTASEETSFTGGPARIEIKHAEVKGKKAIPHVYQTPEASFIWFEESRKSGG